VFLRVAKLRILHCFSKSFFSYVQKIVRSKLVLLRNLKMLFLTRDKCHGRRYVAISGVRIRGSDQNQSVSFRFHHMPKFFFPNTQISTTEFILRVFVVLLSARVPECQKFKM